MKFDVMINALPVHAEYSAECVEQIFYPLLNLLAEKYRKERRRQLVFLAAAPGTGKSTLAEFLKKLSQEDPALEPISVIGMDGFHRYQDYLLSHTTVWEGKEIPMVSIKGHPATFDLKRLERFVKRVADGETVLWPEYDRLTHNPREDAIRVDGNIVLLEGNYLLLDEDGWRDLKNYADYTISITSAPELLKERLVERKILTDVAREKAEKFVEFSDMYNARLVLSKMLPADLALTLVGDGVFTYL